VGKTVPAGISISCSMEQAPREGGRGQVRGDTRLDRQGPRGSNLERTRYTGH